jgi:hypothetical protein
LIGFKDTTVNIFEETHSPFHDFTFVTGERTEEEKYSFNLGFAIFDEASPEFPSDLQRVGKFSVKLDGYYYNSESLAFEANNIDLAYHACTREDIKSFGAKIE